MNKQVDGRLAKGEARRKHLVETAVKVFAERGFAGATIKDIGAAAGMSPALLYHYYESKEDLLNAVVEHYSFVGEMRRLMEKNEKLPVEDFLKMLARHFYDLVGERLDLVRIFLKEGTSNDTVAAAWRGLLNQGFPLIQGYLDRQVGLGRLKPHHTEVTARALGTGIVMLRVTEGVLPPQVVTGHAYIDEFIDVLIKGIKS